MLAIVPAAKGIGCILSDGTVCMASVGMKIRVYNKKLVLGPYFEARLRGYPERDISQAYKASAEPHVVYATLRSQHKGNIRGPRYTGEVGRRFEISVRQETTC